MRILFVVTNIGVVESYGPMYLSALAKQEGHDTLFIRFKHDLVTKTVKEWSPDIIAWSVFSGEFSFMAQLNDTLKETFRFISIFGGPHPTYFPESLFKYKIDFGIVGEGEGAFIELLAYIQNNSKTFSIPNVVTKDKRKTDVRSLIENLDTLPMPDYNGYYGADLWLKDFPVKMFMPSRGCPFKCTYCFNHQYNTMYRRKGPIIRRYSVDRLIEEILFVKKNFPLEFVRFNDDCFVMKCDEWLEELCSKYPRKINLPFFCCIDPTNVSDEIIYMLKGIGLKSIYMSIECGDQLYRKSILERKISNEKLFNSFEILKKYKINILSNNILALPGTTFDNDLKTFETNLQCKPTCALAGIFQPYPKLKLTTYAIENGYLNVDEENQKTPLTIFGKSILNFPEDIKTKQKNLSDVFCLMVSAPYLAKILIPFIGIRAIILPFSVLSSILVSYLYQRKIYPHRLTLKRLWFNMKAALFYFSQTFKA